MRRGLALFPFKFDTIQLKPLFISILNCKNEVIMGSQMVKVKLSKTVRNAWRKKDYET